MTNSWRGQFSVPSCGLIPCTYTFVATGRMKTPRILLRCKRSVVAFLWQIRCYVFKEDIHPELQRKNNPHPAMRDVRREKERQNSYYCIEVSIHFALLALWLQASRMQRPTSVQFLTCQGSLLSLFCVLTETKLNICVFVWAESYGFRRLLMVKLLVHLENNPHFNRKGK